MQALDGDAVDVEAATSPCRFSGRDAAVILARDIGPQLRYERELRELALLDELTGLHNRRGFLTFAEAELRRLRLAGRGAALLFADLDGLKRINDAHGHAAGDEALTAVAHALREVVGAQGLVARWSGDEFVALVHEPPGRPTAPADALLSDVAVAEAFELRLRASIDRRRSPLSPYGVSASVGAHHLPPDGGETLAARWPRPTRVSTSAAPPPAVPRAPDRCACSCSASPARRCGFRCRGRGSASLVGSRVGSCCWSASRRPTPRSSSSGWPRRCSGSASSATPRAG
jgi:diguanylate cyclase (GGDEF)-like protein